MTILSKLSILVVLLVPFFAFGETVTSVPMLGQTTVRFNHQKWKLLKSEHLFNKAVPVLYFNENEKIKVFLNSSILSTLKDKKGFEIKAKELCEKGKLSKIKNEWSCMVQLDHKEMYSRYSILNQNGKKYILARELVTVFQDISDNERKEINSLYDEL